jgi:hypothetical protein
MSNWAIQYPINFTAEGDATNTAIQKHINEITAIYGDLNLLKSSFIGTTAPSSPNSGQPWLDTTNAATTGAVLKMRDYANANWITLFTVASNSIPAVANPIQGGILYYAGDGDTEGWQLLAPGTSGQYLQTKGGAANPVWATVTPSFGMIKGFSAIVKSASTVQLTSENNPFTGAYSNEAFTLSAGGTGANALDAGSIVSNTWYYHFLIYGTKGLASLLSASATAPTLPSGYSQYIRTGAVVTDNDSALRYTSQYGKKVIYQSTSQTEYVSSDSSTATNIVGPKIIFTRNASQWTGVSLATIVPPTAVTGTFRGHYTNASDNGVGWQLTEDGNNTDPAFGIFGGTYSPSSVPMQGDLHLTNYPYIYVWSTAYSTRIFCVGWEDNL